MQRLIIASAISCLLAAPAQLEARTNRNTSGAAPALDISSSCRDISQADPAQTLNYDRCMVEEKSAREHLQGVWASYPASDRDRCLDFVKPPALGSYVTLQGCLDMARDARNYNAKSPDKGSKPNFH